MYIILTIVMKIIVEFVDLLRYNDDVIIKRGGIFMSEDVFCGYIIKNKVYGTFCTNRKNFSQLIIDMSLDKIIKLFESINWIAIPKEASNEELLQIEEKYSEQFLFDGLAKYESLEKALESYYKMTKALNRSKPFGKIDILSDEENIESQVEKAQRIKEALDMSKEDSINIINEAYKIDYDYCKAEKYFIIDFDISKVLGK